MKKILSLVAVVLFTVAFSQSSILNELNNSTYLSSSVLKIGVDDNNDMGQYEGSPFLVKEFLPSTISGEEGKFMLRYNIMDDEIVLRNGSDYYMIPKNSKVNLFRIDGKYTIRLIDNSYYIQVAGKESDQAVVVKKQVVKFAPAKKSQNSYDQSSPAKFITINEDFFVYDTYKNILHEVSSKSLTQSYPERANELKKLMKSRKMKSEADFALLLSIIN